MTRRLPILPTIVVAAAVLTMMGLGIWQLTRAEWKAELEAMRTRMIENRQKLADAIRSRSNKTDFDFVADHRGMFSLLGLKPDTINHLKAENAVYMLDDSRINIAGLADERIERLADAIVAATR